MSVSSVEELNCVSKPQTQQTPTGQAFIIIPHLTISCGICTSVPQDVHVTPCGHSFCYDCLTKYLETQESCPQCGRELARPEMYPNFMLKKLLENVQKSESQGQGFLEKVLCLVQQHGQNVNFDELDQAVEIIRNFKLEKQKVELQSQMLLTKFFLQHARQEKQAYLENIRNQLQKVNHDIQVLSVQNCAIFQQQQDIVPSMVSYVADDQPQQSHQQQQQQQLKPEIKCEKPSTSEQISGNRSTLEKPYSPENVRNVGNSSTLTGSKRVACDSNQNLLGGSSMCSNQNPNHNMGPPQGGMGATPTPSKGGFDDQTPDIPAKKKQRIVQSFSSLMDCYFDLSSTFSTETDGSKSCAGSDPVQEIFPPGLQLFQQTLSTILQYQNLDMIAEFNQKPVVQSKGMHNILSTIDFSANQRHFATCGICHRIDLYDFYDVLQNEGEGVHETVKEIKTTKKLSNLMWNPGNYSQLLSSGYDGTLNLWDIGEGEIIQTYEAHQKRIWSIDFARNDPSIFVSGSDDRTVNVWQMIERRSVSKISENSNVCAVRFNPINSLMVAVGTAGTGVNIYDIRSTQKPMMSLKGHQRSVSYVSFLNGEELVSASTDGTLKLWNVQTGKLERTFTGHVNNRNFVGLSTSNDMIVCGSETNAVHVYYKYMGHPILQHKFQDVGQGSRKSSDFISAVCLKPASKYIVAGSSTGVVQVLEMK